MSDACPGITESVTTANIAIDSIFLLGGGTLFLIWFIGRLAQLRTRSILKWYLYGFALIFYCLSLTLNLAFTVLSACDVGSSLAVTRGFVAVEWFWQFAHWMILATVMLNLCGALFKATSGTAKIVYFISTPILFLVGILMLSFVSLYAAQIQNYDPYIGYYINQNTQGQLNTAELVFNIIGIIVSIIFMVVALGQMSSRNLRVGSLGVWLPLLMIFLLGSACVRLADTIMEFDTLTYTTASLIAVWALENFFIFSIMLILIFVSINTTIKEAINPPRPTPNQPAQLAPSGPQMVQPAYGGNLPQYTHVVPGQPGMQPAYAYQLQPGQQQQQYYQQQPVYVQAPPPMQQAPQAYPAQQMANEQFAQPVSPSREINDAAVDHSIQNKEVVSPVAEKPAELPQAEQPELP